MAHMTDTDAMHFTAGSDSRRLAAFELGSGSNNAHALLLSGANVISEDALSKAMASVGGVKDVDVQKNLAEMLLGRHMSNGQLMVRQHTYAMVRHHICHGFIPESYAACKHTRSIRGAIHVICEAFFLGSATFQGCVIFNVCIILNVCPVTVP